MPPLVPQKILPSVGVLLMHLTILLLGLASRRGLGAARRSSRRSSTLASSTQALSLRSPTLDPGIDRLHPDRATQPIKYTSHGLVWVLTPFNTLQHPSLCLPLGGMLGLPASTGEVTTHFRQWIRSILSPHGLTDFEIPGGPSSWYSHPRIHHFLRV